MTETNLGTRAGFVALIGEPNAGKSTLLNRMVGAKVSIVTHKVQTTRARIRGVAMEGQSQIVFVEDGNERLTSPPLSPKRDAGSSKTTATPKTPPHHYHVDFDRISLPNLQGGEQPPSTPQNWSPGRRAMLAPLSPQSSVGHASVSSARSGVSTNHMSATREQYRALTSTSTDRKRTVGHAAPSGRRSPSSRTHSSRCTAAPRRAPPRGRRWPARTCSTPNRPLVDRLLLCVYYA